MTDDGGYLMPVSWSDFDLSALPVYVVQQLPSYGETIIEVIMHPVQYDLPIVFRVPLNDNDNGVWGDVA
jgi:hypothetical protein